MKIVDKISLRELHEMAKKMDGNIVKADVDVATHFALSHSPRSHLNGYELPLLPQHNYGYVSLGLKALARSGALWHQWLSAKCVVARKIVIIDMPMHFEGEQELLKQGSKQKDLWGINLLPAQYGADGFIAFDSMINIKVHHNNPSMNVQSAEIRSQITTIIDEVVHE